MRSPLRLTWVCGEADWAAGRNQLPDSELNCGCPRGRKRGLDLRGGLNPSLSVERG